MVTQDNRGRGYDRRADSQSVSQYLSRSIDYKTANATDAVSTAIAQSRYAILRDYQSTRGRLSVTLTQQALVPNPAQTNDYAQ